MWHLRLKGGLELSEQELGNWDAVPATAEIDRAGLCLARAGERVFVIEIAEMEAYAIARTAAGVVGGALIANGYCLYGRRGEVVTELTILPSGMQMKSYPIDKCDLPERCWRRGGNVP
jgi:hypothetical protein